MVRGLLTSCVFSVIFLLSTGCSNGFKAQRGLASSGSTAISSEVSVNGDELVTDADLKISNLTEVTFKTDVSTDYQKWSEEFLEKDVVLTALIHRACVQNGGDDLSLRIIGDTNTVSQLTQRIVALNFKLAEKTSLGAIATESKASECVLKIENEKRVEIGITSNDTESSKQNYLNQIKWQDGVDLLDHKESDKPVVVAVIDSGVDYNHEDLAAVMWKDSEGRHGYDFYDRDYDPMDEHFHGTYVSGIVAAHTNNGKGVAGVASAGVQIMALKATGASGTGTITSIINSIYYALGNGADVINISMGVKFDSPILEIALQDAVKQNVLVVVAAGNDGLTLSNVYDKDAKDKVFVGPASYSSRMLGVIAVGATSSPTSLASFSNFHPEKVEMAAPGTQVYSTAPNNGYMSAQGTSASSPIVAAAGAILAHKLKNINQAYHVADLETYLTQNSRKVSSLQTKVKDGNFLDFSVLKSTWEKKGWTVSDFPEPTPLPPTTPDAPTGDPDYIPRAYMGELESVTFNEATQMVELTGWACRYGFPESQTITLFFLGGKSISNILTSLAYVDFAGTLEEAGPAIREKCGTQVTPHRFKKEISAGQIRKMKMENTYIHAFLSNTYAESTLLTNGAGDFRVPKVPESGQTYPDDGTYEILGDVTSVEYSPERQRLEVKGWACEVGDTLPTDVYIAVDRPGDDGYMTFDITKAELPSGASVLSTCKTDAAHNFEGYVSLNSIQQRDLEGQPIRVRANGAYRNATVGHEIATNRNLTVPTLTDEDLNTDPTVGQVLGQIESITFNQELRSFEIKGWICEQGNSNSISADILLDRTNRASKADQPSTNAVKAACLSNGNHNFTVIHEAIQEDGTKQVQAGEEVILRTTLFGTKYVIEHDSPVVIPDYVIEDTTPRQNIIGEITALEVDKSTNTLTIRGWICNKGVNQNLNTQIHIYNVAGTHYTSTGTKADLPSNASVRAQCDSIGNHNFEQTKTITNVEDFLVPGNKVLLRVYPAVEGEPFVRLEDDSYVIPNF